MTGDLFHSHRCECGEQLDAAMKLASEQGGIIIYLRQEGRGIGLINKLKAYKIQDTGVNTADANTHLGLEVDAREYDTAITIMKNLGIKKVKLLTNNPDKIAAIELSDIEVEKRIPLIIPPKKENHDYLKTKQDLMGHLFKI
jgi:GTP cyclohydrolase II